VWRIDVIYTGKTVEQQQLHFVFVFVDDCSVSNWQSRRRLKSGMHLHFILSKIRLSLGLWVLLSLP